MRPTCGVWLNLQHQRSGSESVLIQACAAFRAPMPARQVLKQTLSCYLDRPSAPIISPTLAQTRSHPRHKGIAAWQGRCTSGNTHIGDL